MSRTVEAMLKPARTRVGLPVLPDGSTRRPILLRLPGDEGACNNGCADCVTRPVEGPWAAWDAEVAERHVVLRDREPTLRRDLPQRVRELRTRAPRSVALLTNGRMLVYPQLVRALRDAGVDRFVVKLFGVDAAEHDAHTREPGSFAQALRGIAAARGAGADVLVTFPCVDSEPNARAASYLEARRALAQGLTGRATVQFPDEQVLAHDGGHGYDVVMRRATASQGLRGYPFTRINTGPACNIRCTYCSVDGGDDQRLYDRPYVESLIDDAARRGLAERREGAEPLLDFLGGEPTLHPELPQFIAHARSRGFRDVGICTNGLLLLKPGYLARLVAAGLTTVNLSFHAHLEGEARALAAVGAYGGRVSEAAELLLARDDVRCVFFRILLASTLETVLDWVRWVVARARPGHRPLLAFGLPTVRGRMSASSNDFPPLERLRPILAEALSIAEAHGHEVSLGPGPACLYSARPDIALSLQTQTLRANTISGRTEPLHYDGETRFGERCARCAAREDGCGGLPVTYFTRDPAAAEAWLSPWP